jgi:uncharacterized membrane protein YbhN (UPF0104 family)
MKRKRHKYLLYISLVFLVFAVYKANYLQVPAIRSLPNLVLAFLFLFGGFVLSAISQQRLLKNAHYAISTGRAVAAVGLNIFGKYIPGKLWVVAGKALYLEEKEAYPVAELSVLFMRAQILALWCGLVLGIAGLFLNNSLQMVGLAGLVALIIITVITFSESAHDAALGVIAKVFKKKIDLPMLKFRQTLGLIPWFMGSWLCWGVGFFLLAISISDRMYPFSAIFCFPLAATLGIIFLFAPGGLGIREGIIVGYLALLNIALPEAITLSAVSRLWFLIGELFIFLAGYISDKGKYKV